MVLLNDAGGDAPAGADRDALVFRPRPDIAAALRARGPPRPTALSPPGPAGMIDERGELLAERRGVLGAQIDLILGAVHPEPHRLIRGAPIKIILEFDGYLLCYPGLLAAPGLPAPRSTVMAAGTEVPPSTSTDALARHSAIKRHRDSPRREPGVPIANEDPLVSYLTLWVTIKLTCSAF